MPSQAMQDLLESLRERQKASADLPPETLEEARATFAPGGPLHAIPDDVLVSEVSAGGVPAYWLDAPDAAGRPRAPLPAWRRLSVRFTAQ